MKPRYQHRCDVCGYLWTSGEEIPPRCANKDCRSVLWDGRGRRKPGPKKQINGVTVIIPRTISECRAICSLHDIMRDQAPGLYTDLYALDREYMRAEIPEPLNREIRRFLAENISPDTDSDHIDEAYRALNMVGILQESRG